MYKFSAAYCYLLLLGPMRQLSMSVLVQLVLFLANFFAQYLDKRLFIQLNGGRKVIGVLRGYDVSSEAQRIARLAQQG